MAIFSFDMDFEEGGDNIYGKCKYDHTIKELIAKYVPIDKYPIEIEGDDSDYDSFYDTLEKVLADEEYSIIKLEDL